MSGKLRNTKGYFIVDRCIQEDWKWQRVEWRSAWLWCLVRAAFKDKPEEGLKRGQFWFSIYWAEDEWGMTTNKARYFLSRCVQEGDIVWEKGTGGRPDKNSVSHTVNHTVNHTVSHTHLGRITISKYTAYQARCSKANTDSHTDSNSVSHAILKEGIKESKKKVKVLPASDEACVTPNSQVYDFYIKTKAQMVNRPDWLPTANQAKQIRANIKTLLETQGYTPDELVSWLTRFFADEKMANELWPWQFFMTDPLRWSQRPAGKSKKNNWREAFKNDGK